MARIGVNALYLIPGGVGGTEIYLRELLGALAKIDSTNQYFIFTNLETGADLVPRQANFSWKPQAFRASFRPGRILWEQTVLPVEAARADWTSYSTLASQLRSLRPAATCLPSMTCNTSAIRNTSAGSTCRSGACCYGL